MNINQQYVHVKVWYCIRCVILLFYVLMIHIILYAWIQWCNKTTQILLTPPYPHVISDFWLAKEVNEEVKTEVVATVLIKNIKYYENTKYTLKKGKKIRTNVMCLSSSHKCKIFFRAIEMHCKQNMGAEWECIAKSMVTFLKFPLAYSMKFIKIYSI
jgi:hypothetical protein